MSQQAEYDATGYRARLTEFANRLALKHPDLKLLLDHPGDSESSQSRLACSPSIP